MALAKIAQQYNVIVVHDAIYAHKTDFSHHLFSSMAHYYPQNTILTGGLSKIFSAGGWRLGFLALPSTDSWHQVRQALKFKMSETISGVNVPLQKAATLAFTPDSYTKEYLSCVAKVHQYVLTYAWEKFQKLGISCPKPQGGFYLFPSFKNQVSALTSQKILTSTDLVASLYEHGICVLPGDAFGCPLHSLTTRWALVDFDGNKGVCKYKIGAKSRTICHYLHA